MEALTELCDLVAQNPDLFADKLAFICSRCPPAAVLQPPPTGVGSARITRSHLHALIALARFLSRCSDYPAAVSNVRSTLVDFLRAIPSVAFRLSFWPQSYSIDTISVFFSDLLRYISIAADLSPALGSDLSIVIGNTVVSAAASTGDEMIIARVFLSAFAQNCPPIPAADAEWLVTCLLEQFVPEDEGVSSSGSENSTSWGSSTLSKGKVLEDDRDVADDGSSEISSVQNGGSVGGRSSAGSNGGGGGGGSAAFQVESVEGLEKLEIAFRLVRQVVDRPGIKIEQLELFLKCAVKQLKSLPAFLKVVARMFLMCIFYAI